MNCQMLTRSVLICALFLFITVKRSSAIDNLLVAYPSMNTSVFALVIAQKEGYFKEEGLNVELLSIRGEIAIRTTLAGEVDFFTNAGSALAAVVRAVPVKIVTVFQDKPSWDLIAQPDIKSIAQLRGKTIGVMSPEGSLAVVAREIRAALKGINFFVSKREPAIKYMMDGLRMTDRELVNSIYDIQSKLILREGFTDDKVLQSMIDEMKKTTKVQREIKVGDVFDLSFVKKANEELKASGWKP